MYLLFPRQTRPVSRRAGLGNTGTSWNNEPIRWPFQEPRHCAVSPNDFLTNAWMFGCPCMRRRRHGSGPVCPRAVRDCALTRPPNPINTGVSCRPTQITSPLSHPHTSHLNSTTTMGLATPKPQRDKSASLTCEEHSYSSRMEQDRQQERR